MREQLKVVVTGEHEATDGVTELADGRKVEWVELNVLNFERLPVEKEFIEGLIQNPFHWILFTSQRTVQFWSETLLEYGVDFPVETQVATIGERTSEIAGEQGYSPDFYPTEPGSETFLEEFKDLLSNTSDRPRILIPQAANGRTYLREKLEALGCEVVVLPLYKTIPVEAAPVDSKILEDASLILFTSPSSHQAFQKHYKVPKQARVGAIGKFTYNYLLQNGISADLLPGGQFERVGEILC